MRSTAKQVRRRIEHTLARLKFDDIGVTVDNDGNVSLVGAVASLDDQSLK